jgi:hypothetical protein
MDGTLLARYTYYKDGTDVGIWDIKQDRLIKSFPYLSGVQRLAFSYDSRVVAAGANISDNEHAVYLLQVENRDGGVGSEPDVLRWSVPRRFHRSFIVSVAFSKNGYMLAAANSHGDVRVWNLNAARLNLLRERPIVQQDLEWVQAALRSGVLSHIERQWLDFAEHLITPQCPRLARPVLRSREINRQEIQHRSSVSGKGGNIDWSDYEGGHYRPQPPERYPDPQGF